MPTYEDDVRPWDRRRNETSVAYEAFVTYRDMGASRNYRRVAEVLGKSGTLISGWSTKHDWVARACAWDSMPGRAVEEAYDQMAARVAAQHEQLATKLLSKLDVNLDRLQEGKDPSQNWSLAHSAARQGHQFAMELVKPTDAGKAEITKAIENLVNRLAGEE